VPPVPTITKNWDASANTASHGSGAREHMPMVIKIAPFWLSCCSYSTELSQEDMSLISRHGISEIRTDCSDVATPPTQTPQCRGKEKGQGGFTTGRKNVALGNSSLCIYFNAAKQQITLQKISPMEGALDLFSAGGAEFELMPLIG